MKHTIVRQIHSSLRSKVKIKYFIIIEFCDLENIFFDNKLILIGAFKK